jgi:hypothetical protein
VKIEVCRAALCLSIAVAQMVTPDVPTQLARCIDPIEGPERDGF